MLYIKTNQDNAVHAIKGIYCKQSRLSRKYIARKWGFSPENGNCRDATHLHTISKRSSRYCWQWPKESSGMLTQPNFIANDQNCTTSVSCIHNIHIIYHWRFTKLGSCLKTTFSHKFPVCILLHKLSYIICFCDVNVSTSSVLFLELVWSYNLQVFIQMWFIEI